MADAPKNPSPQSNTTGWLYDNEDTGREYSDDHPIESGEVTDATNVVPATAENLLSELKSSWKAWNEDRAELASSRSRLYDAGAFMADGGDTPMTAAEAVLAWLLIEKIGVPDDVCYSPDQAQEIIVRRLDLARELEEIDAMLAEGQGDDEGHPIMPEFTKGMTTYAKIEACLHLLERRRDALHPAPQTNVQGPNFGSHGSATAMFDVIAERLRQQEKEGWSPEHDNAHKNGELAGAAACYVLHGLDAKIQNIQLGHRVVQLARDLWPWGMFWWKPTDRRRDLVKAAALIIAEIERLDRAALAAEGQAE